MLNLAHNLFNFLPADFGTGMRNLQYLDLSHNRITYLPEALFASPPAQAACGALQVLVVEHNQLKALPESLG